MIKKGLRGLFEHVRQAIKSQNNWSHVVPNPFVSLFWMKIWKNGFWKNNLVPIKLWKNGNLKIDYFIYIDLLLKNSIVLKNSCSDFTYKLCFSKNSWTIIASFFKCYKSGTTFLPFDVCATVTYVLPILKSDLSATTTSVLLTP